MLSKSHRLTTAEIASVMETGKRIDFPFFWSKSLPSPVFKIAILIPKKVFSKAHERNKARRLIYTLLDMYKDNFPTVFLALTLKKKFSKEDMGLINKDIQSLL